MIIKARFADRCRVCSKPIAAGTKIEWIRGARPAHLSCAVSKIVKDQEPDAQYEEDYGRALALSEAF